MLVVKIEIWPFGNEAEAREIARAEIWNDGTGTTEFGNYGMRVAEPLTGITRDGVQFRGWPRALGALRLVAETLKAAGLTSWSADKE